MASVPGGHAEDQDVPPQIESWLIVTSREPERPEQVTATLQVEPTRIVESGRGGLRRASHARSTVRRWSWQLREGPEASYDHPGQLSALLDRLDDKASSALLHHGRTQGWSVKVALRATYAGSSPNWTFQPELLERIAGLGAQLEFDPVYVGEP